MDRMKLLVTGGTGYIGSHTCVELLNAGYEIHIMDNLSNSKSEVCDRIAQICGKEVGFSKLDLLDQQGMDALFTEHSFAAVIHFAGLKAVGESCAEPLMYYQNNISGTLNLLSMMQKHGIKNIIFSSSATVYGDSDQVPYSESSALKAINPYGNTKLVIEQILCDYCNADPAFTAVCLRYFNPVGAHPSALLGEDPNGLPNNLMPHILMAASGKKALTIFGDDYPTPDGTCIRDYIHVVDLAKGHLAALKAHFNSGGASQYNLGTGQGSSVFEIVKTFAEVNNVKIECTIGERRAGDAPTSFAKVTKAKNLLNWEAVHSLSDMCIDSWRWYEKSGS